MITWSAGLRWSYSSRAWMGFLAALPNGVLICRHELTWRQVPSETAAADIKAAMLKWKIDRLTYVAANPEIFPKQHEYGRTEAESFYRGGIPLRMGSDDRLNAWACLRSWIATRERQDKSRGPMLLIHPDCKVLLRTLPTLVSSPTSPDDVVESPDEYPAFGLALCLMARPSPATVETPKLPDWAVGHLVQELRDAYDT